MVEAQFSYRDLVTACFVHMDELAAWSSELRYLKLVGKLIQTRVFYHWYANLTVNYDFSALGLFLQNNEEVMMMMKLGNILASLLGINNATS